MSVELYLLFKDPNGYFVRFIDYDGTLISEEWVDAGGSAILPSSPSHNGMTFIGWNNSHTNINEDTVIRATYSNLFLVNWHDLDGSILKTEYVSTGGNATPPADPVHNGYLFLNWDKVYTNIQSNMDIYALFESTTPTWIVRFIDWDGSVLKSEQLFDGESATAPVKEQDRDFYWFNGWDKTFNNVHSNLDVNTTYIYSTSMDLYVQSYNNVPVSACTSNPMTIDWGDGTQTVITGSSFTISVHTYPHNGWYKWNFISNTEIFFESRDKAYNFLNLRTKAELYFIRNVKFSYNVKTIKANTFQYMGYYINNVYKFADSVTSIGTNSFSGNNLNSLVFGNGLLSIGPLAFYQNVDLTGNIIFPSSLQSIGQAAFYGCSGYSLTFNSIVPPTIIGNAVNAGVFGNTPDIVTNIYVPSGSLNAYKTAPVWSDYASKITAIV